MSRLLAIAFILFCFEVGIFLILIPWSVFWDSNLLLEYVSVLRPLVLHTFFRAGVSILGAIDIFIGATELRYFLKSLKVVNRSTL
jgi:hypothetical protein